MPSSLHAYTYTCITLDVVLSTRKCFELWGMMCFNATYVTIGLGLERLKGEFLRLARCPCWNSQRKTDVLAEVGGPEKNGTTFFEVCAQRRLEGDRGTLLILARFRRRLALEHPLRVPFL